MTWAEVGADVFARRYEPWDVTVGVIRSENGLLVVDTRATPSQAGELLADLRSLDRRPPRWVVNTHAHFDHTFGNGSFAAGGAEIWGHAMLPAALRAGRHDAPDDAEHGGVALVEPDHLVTDRASLDLGDRTVELRHLGPAHTDGDLVVWLPEAGVVFAGDLIEESGPPAYGLDSFPLEWPAALEGLLGLGVFTDGGEGNDVRFVPGHGAVVDRAFVEAQRNEVASVAVLLTELWEDGVPSDKALEAGGDRWPWPGDRLQSAVAVAYAQLGERVSGGRGSDG